MATQLSICNSALGRLGELPITAVDAASTAHANSRVCAREWQDALDELLRAFPWNWAKARATLEEFTGSPLFEWDHHFLLPDDYVTLLAINETSVGQAGDWWEIENGLLLTDEASVDAEYIYRPTASGLDAFLDGMDPLARAALVTLLASKIAPTVTKDGLGKADQLLERYHRVDLAQARLRGAGEQKAPHSTTRTDSAWDESRYGP